MSRIGVRCLECNTDVWMSPVEVKSCKCKNVNISLEGLKPTIGKKRGTPYLVIREEDDGTITTQEPIDTGRAPEPRLDEANAQPRFTMDKTDD